MSDESKQRIAGWKTKKKRCPGCLVGGYRQIIAGDGRPMFVCTACDYRWTDGHEGGEWALVPRGQISGAAS